MIRTVLKRFSVSHFFGSLLQAFGLLWLLVEITAYFFADRPWAGSIRSGWWVFLLAGIAIGIYRAWPKLNVKSRISDTDVDVEVRVGDIFSTDGAILVGSNTTFDTTIEDDTISKNSIQGQFTKRFCSSILELDRHIDAALNGVTPICTRSKTDKPYGKVSEYEFGTVAPIEVGGKRAYFAAVARLNEHRVASSERDKFLDALPRIWESIRSRGGFEPLCCPILGSGFSRLNLTRQQLLHEIIKSFVAATIEAKFCEKLTVIIHSNDFRKGHVDLDKVGRFLEHECVYARSISKPAMPGPVGIPME